jgi:hypothetical protein
MLYKFTAVLLTLVGISLFLISGLRSSGLDGYHVLKHAEMAAATRADDVVTVKDPVSGSSLRFSKRAFERLMFADPYWYWDGAAANADLGRNYRTRMVFFYGMLSLSVSLIFWGLYRRQGQAKQRADGKAADAKI